MVVTIDTVGVKKKKRELSTYLSKRRSTRQSVLMRVVVVAVNAARLKKKKKERKKERKKYTRSVCVCMQKHRVWWETRWCWWPSILGMYGQTVMVLSKLRISNKEKKKIKTNQLTRVGGGGLRAR